MKKIFTPGLLTCEKQNASRKISEIFKLLLVFPVILLLFGSLSSFAQDLMIRDCLADETNNGAEPSNCSSAIYASDGIKLAKDPFPNYTPYPFVTGGPGDIWATYPDEDAEYRDPTKYSKPNWIYVRVTNPVTAGGASNGNEVLKVYWAKGSTGLSWSSDWIDAFGTFVGCPPDLYIGDEVTKPRRNWTSLSTIEKGEVVTAILDADLTLYSVDNVSYWDKQDQIHQSTHVHHGPEFLPWHRELVNRFENLLRNSKPNLKLPYWDWTTSPLAAGSDILGTNDPEHFGSSSGLTGIPFTPLHNNAVCPGSRGDNATCNPTCPQTLDWTDPPRKVDRAVGSLPCCTAPTSVTDNDIVNSSNSLPNADQFPWFRDGVFNGNSFGLEIVHDYGHVYIGGQTATIGCVHAAFEDPFVYMLHSNTDKIFAMWQRQPEPANAYLFRLDNSNSTSGIYGNEYNANATIQDPLHPWDGVVAQPPFIPIPPWDGTENQSTTYFDQSVVTPPIYDMARLTIPVLQPGESVIMQVPWYPPYPDDYSPCFADWHHFCVLARIEEPMTCAEITDVGANTLCNNNIAWKNVQLYDILPNSQFTACVLMRNMQKERSTNKLRIRSQETGAASYFANGTCTLNLPAPLFELWDEGGKVGGNIEWLGEYSIKLLNENAWIGNLALEQEGEGYEVCLVFNTNDAFNAAAGVFHVNLEQEDNLRFVGGEQFKLRTPGSPRISKPVSSESFIYKRIYPNPNNGNMQMDYTLNSNEKGELSIYDYAGRNIATYYLEAGENTLVITEPLLSNGVYIYQVKVSDKIIDTDKLVIIK